MSLTSNVAFLCWEGLVLFRRSALSVLLHIQKEVCRRPHQMLWVCLDSWFYEDRHACYYRNKLLAIGLIGGKYCSCRVRPWWLYPSCFDFALLGGNIA